MTSRFENKQRGAFHPDPREFIELVPIRIYRWFPFHAQNTSQTSAFQYVATAQKEDGMMSLSILHRAKIFLWRLTWSVLFEMCYVHARGTRYSGVRPSAATTRSSITWYCVRQWAKIYIGVLTHEMHPIPCPDGPVMGLFCANWQNNWPHYSGTQHCTENEYSSAQQFRRHWWQHKLSFWQLVVPPGTIRPSNRRPTVLSVWIPPHISISTYLLSIRHFTKLLIPGYLFYDTRLFNALGTASYPHLALLLTHLAMTELSDASIVPPERWHGLSHFANDHILRKYVLSQVPSGKHSTNT